MPIISKLSDRQGVIGTGTEDQTRRLNMTFFKNLIRDEQGATAIEYGLIAALIAVAAITAMTALGGELNETFVKVDSDLNAANKGTPPAAD
jgi:pilus assembly protein Flp/PilA